MLKIEKNPEYFVTCGPLAKFLLLKLIFRPAQQSQFDMPDLDPLHGPLGDPWTPG